MNPSICPLCGASENQLKASLKEEQQLRVCLVCDLHFVHPFKVPEGNFYDQDYYRSWGMRGNELPEHVFRLKEVNMRRHLDEIKKFARGGKILEVGSAMGSFLKVAQADGFDVIGVELSSQACEVARSHVGRGNVLNDTLENVDLKPESMDVIFMSDLIEHIPEPLPFLEKAVSLLKTGGLLYFITPDPQHWSRFVFGKRWVHYKDEHLMFFSRRTFSWLAAHFDCEFIDFTPTMKYTDVSYLLTQLKHFRYDLLSGFISVFEMVLPIKMTEWLFPVSLGESRCILRKINRYQS